MATQPQSTTPEKLQQASPLCKQSANYVLCSTDLNMGNVISKGLTSKRGESCTHGKNHSSTSSRRTSNSLDSNKHKSVKGSNRFGRLGSRKVISGEKRCISELTLKPIAQKDLDKSAFYFSDISRCRFCLYV